MVLKPQVFIGSSFEGLEVAEKVKKLLSRWATCTIWDQEVFTFNKSYFDTLVKSINLYDIGVLVATADDFSQSRSEVFDVPRDNVIFEFGLFLGGLGPRKAFLVCEDGLKLPSDLLGISLPSFPGEAGKAQDEALRGICARIKREIDKRGRTFELGLLPSVSLAHGYFENFVLRTCQRLIEQKHIVVDGRSLPIEEFSFKILIPNDLSADMYDKVTAKRHSRKWQSIKVDAGAMRPYDFHVDLSSNVAGHIEIYDIPLTLNSLHQAIQQHLEKAHLGRDYYERMLEYREISGFRNVLDLLIESNDITRTRVSTEIVPV